MNDPGASSGAVSLFDVWTAPDELFAALKAGPVRWRHFLLPPGLSWALGWALTEWIHGDAPAPGEVLGIPALARGIDLLCGNLAGVIWSAAVLWGIARFGMKRPIRFGKSVEAAGLAAMVQVLNTAVTGLLIQATGDVRVQAGLGWLSKEGTGGVWAGFLSGADLFGCWAAAVLTIALARLSGCRRREAGLWVGVFWVGGRWLAVCWGVG